MVFLLRWEDLTNNLYTLKFIISIVHFSEFWQAHAFIYLPTQSLCIIWINSKDCLVLLCKFSLLPSSTPLNHWPVLLLQEIHRKRIMQNVIVFYVGPLLAQCIWESSLYFVSQYLILLYYWVVFNCMNRSLVTHTPVEGIGSFE